MLIAGVIDEEYASLGAEALVKEWRADAAVIGEPTHMVVAIGHKGFSWVEVTTEGRAAHGSRPREGRDAILRMGRVLSRLEALDRRLQSGKPHPVLGTGSLHASFVSGGRELSTYPDRCTLQMERRTVSGEAEEIASGRFKRYLRELRDEDPEFTADAKLMFVRPPYETPPEHDLPRLIEAGVARAGRTTHRSGMSFWTDAAILGHAGIPSVVFGPGGAGLHGLEEYVLADEVLACRDVLADLAHDFCA